MKLLEAGLLLIIITVTHSFTAQQQEGRTTIPVATPVEAMQKCSEAQERQSIATNAKPQEFGKTSVRCLLKHPDGTTLQIVPQLDIGR